MAENASPQRSIQTDMSSKTKPDPNEAAARRRGAANEDTAPKDHLRRDMTEDIDEMWDNVPI